MNLQAGQNTLPRYRGRLASQSRWRRCRRSIGASLEKYNLASPTALPELPRLQAALRAEQGISAAHLRSGP